MPPEIPIRKFSDFGSGLGIHQCDSAAFCFDTLGSYGCICDDGYSGDGFTCEFIDMCVGANCRSDEDCRNTEDGYECVEKPYSCPPTPAYWLGRKHNLFKYQGDNSVILRTNVLNNNPDVDVLNDAYIGFIMFSKKQCSNQFLVGVDSGSITFSVLDKSPLYR